MPNIPPSYRGKRTVKPLLSAMAAAALAFSLPLSAQAADPNPASVPAGAYAVEPNHTRIVFSVNHLGFNDYFGELSGITGSLKLDPDHLDKGQIDISAPVKNISTTNAKLDGELKGAEWFDEAQFPAIRFVSTGIARTGEKTATISGNLTVHGVTRPFVMEAAFVGSGVNPINKNFTAGFSAKGQFKRSEFGVTKFVPLVGDEVTLIISAAFEKQAS